MIPFLFLAIIWIVQCTQDQICSLLKPFTISATQQQIAIVISSAEIQKQKLSCLSTLFNRGFYSSCKTLVEKYPQLSSQLDHLISNRKIKINLLLEQLDMPTSTIQPSMKWAQNMTHVFIHFKLSHRLDSPPCINIKKEVIKTTILNASKEVQSFQGDGSKFQFFCECVVSHQRIYFKSNLDFWANASQLQFKKQGYGGFTVVVEKQQSAIWRWLDKSHRRITFWQQIKEKYKDDMDKYFTLIDEQEQQSLKKIKKRRKRIDLLDEL